MRATAFVVVALCALSGAANAQAVTATCKDGTSWSGSQRSGACRGHQGCTGVWDTHIHGRSGAGRNGTSRARNANGGGRRRPVAASSRQPHKPPWRAPARCGQHCEPCLSLPGRPLLRSYQGRPIHGPRRPRSLRERAGPQQGPARRRWTPRTTQRRLIVAEFDQDELACRIFEALHEAPRSQGLSAAQALQHTHPSDASADDSGSSSGHRISPAADRSWNDAALSPRWTLRDPYRAAGLLIQQFGAEGASVHAAARCVALKLKGDDAGLRAWVDIATAIHTAPGDRTH